MEETEFTTINKSADDFELGELVFLRRNPEVQLRIVGLHDPNIVITHYTCPTDGEVLELTLPARSLMQYRNAGLLLWKKEFVICLN